MKKFALLMALMLCLVSLVACGDKPAEEAPAATGETLTGTAEGFSTDTEIEVEVVKDGDTITAVTVTNHGESVDDIEEVKTALESVPAAIVEANGTEGVDVVTGATYTSEGIINAVNNALGQ
ncbi:MAG: FMN-binding protein [Tissierellia bacterium]|nr:FMN-binding protein [Tissierellia bacterium]